MSLFRYFLFFSMLLTALSFVACAEDDVQTKSACEWVLDCASERCVTDPSQPADAACAQQCYCDQICGLGSTPCAQTCMAADATTLTPVNDFMALTNCMASKNCGDQSCAETQCAFTYQTCRFSDGDMGMGNGEGSTSSRPDGAHRQTPDDGTNTRQDEITEEGNQSEDGKDPGDTSGGDPNTGSGTQNGGTTGSTPTTDSFVGQACASDTDCGVSGAICMDLPGGYCTLVACANTSGICPEGSQCYNFQDGESFCLDSCADASECRVAEGYACDSYNTCWPKGSSGGNSPVGGPCATDSDCADAGAQCYPEFSQGNPTGFINGYCLIPDCSQTSCPAGATCEAIFQGGGTACLSECVQTDDCRNTEGYSCMSGTDGGMCFRGCGAGST